MSERKENFSISLRVKGESIPTLSKEGLAEIEEVLRRIYKADTAISVMNTTTTTQSIVINLQRVLKNDK